MRLWRKIRQIQKNDKKNGEVNKSPLHFDSFGMTGLK